MRFLHLTLGAIGVGNTVAFAVPQRTLAHARHTTANRRTGHDVDKSRYGGGGAAAAEGSSSSLCGRHAMLPATSIAQAQASLHADPTFCLALLFALSTLGLSLERRTTLGKALSAPLATMALALAAANVGCLPFSSPVYAAVNQFAVPLAVPMLLFDSNLRRVVRDTGSLLAAFGVGALATVLGTVGAVVLVPLGKNLGGGAEQQGTKVAAALAARHIGGAINFVAVAETLRIPGTLVSAAIAADNVVVALYFAMLFSLAKANDEKDDKEEEEGADANADAALATKIIQQPTIETELDYSLDDPNTVTTTSSSTTTSTTDSEITLSTLSVALSVASALVMLGKILTRILLPTGTSALPVVSMLTVTAATIAPSFFSRIRTAGTCLGILFIQMFFAASGAAGSIALVLQQAPSLFVFSALQIAIHFGVLLAVGRLFLKLPANELYLASNACVGGPTTAAAMAQAKNWQRLVLPALLVGILGYAAATGIALALLPLLTRLPVLVSRTS